MENAMNNGWHDGSVENMAVYLDENVETVVTLEKRKVSTMEDDGCA